MLEIPETQTLARKLRDTLSGRTISAVFNATHPHKFAWYAGDPHAYPDLLAGRSIRSAAGYGPIVNICFDGDMHITVDDGTNLRYYAPGAAVPANYRLLLVFEDGHSGLYRSDVRSDLRLSRQPGQCLFRRRRCEMFDSRRGVRRSLFRAAVPGLRAESFRKALLATGQRIPGLDNGVLQDVLFRAGINPQRNLQHATPPM